ncbi:MAG TPA: MFS transporter [Terriglobales bacterium]|jgi:DHA1 family bicyclomycin/chloramphenicol resistance-like MFS transporter|nr:MFS transporter [Terriglobales bacterium]
MKMSFQPRWSFFIALVSITLIGPLSLHLFIPAMSAVKEGFGVSTGMAQLTMSLAMLSMAFFTVAYGGLSDRFGRRPVLLAGLVLFTSGAAACMAAANMPMLLAGRTLQGAGAGCGVVLARAIARDVYGQERVAQVIAYLTAAYVLGPMFAPLIGGQLTTLFGWRALFVLASAVGLLVILAVIFGVPETRADNAVLPHGILVAYKSLLRRPRFVGFMLQPGMMSAAFYTQATAASFLAAEQLGADAARIGWWFFAFPIGFMAGSFIAARVGAKRSIEFMTILGGVIGVANGVLLVGWLYFGGISMAALYIPGIFVSLAQGLSMPYAQAGAMAVDPELAGSASGAVVFSQFFWPAALQQLTGLLANGTWVPMAAVQFAAVTVALVAAWMAARPEA